MKSSNRYIPLAKIIREWGIRGQVRVALFNPDSDILFKQKTFYLKGEADASPLKLKSAKEHGKFWLLHFQGYDSPEAAQVLRGKVLEIPRKSLPKTDPNEVYLVDLEGLQVIDSEKRNLGAVITFQKVGETEVMMIGESLQDSIGVPYRSDFIQETNLEEGYIQLTELALDLFEIGSKNP